MAIYLGVRILSLWVDIGFTPTSWKWRIEKNVFHVGPVFIYFQ